FHHHGRESTYQTRKTVQTNRATSVLAVERNETDWIVAVDGLDHATCPLCGIQSISRHSSYRRTLQDLSAQGKPVSVRARMTRWRCRNDVSLRSGPRPA